MISRRWRKAILSVTVMFLLTAGNGFAQLYQGPGNGKPDVFKSSITTLEPFRFGVFYPGDVGGTVTLTCDGVRTATGSVVLLPYGIVGPAVFELVTPSNSMVHLHYQNQIHLKRAVGDFIVMLPGELSLGNPFISPAGAENGFLVTLGGDLELSRASRNPPGEYIGTLHINIVVE